MVSQSGVLLQKKCEWKRDGEKEMEERVCVECVRGGKDDVINFYTTSVVL